MPHVELSLSEATDLPVVRSGGSSLDRWSGAVETAGEPCLVVDGAGIVMAVSPGCRALFGLDPVAALGNRLIAVLDLVDFSAAAAALPDWEAERIPPLLAVTSGGLARGLLRVDDHTGNPRTVDAVSAPLRDGSTVVGSITYFAPVNR